MIDERITDPKKISKTEIQTMLNAEKNPIIQFSKNCYSTSLLKKIDYLCEIFGDQLKIRFYGHCSGEFDANVLRYLPNVKNLSLDCLLHIENHEEVGKLENLNSLSFGVYYFDDKQFLSKLDLNSLKSLMIGENHKRNINLSYLSECKSLEELYVVGHTKHIETLGSLPKLQKLSLSSIGKKQSIQFVNKIQNLESLTLILGGRESIEELNNPNLEKIEIIRVRGLETLGDLSRFHKLCYLHIEDQIKVKELFFSKPLSDLTVLKIFTCKNLAQLHGISNLHKLNDLRIYGTNIDFEDIISNELPEKLSCFAFYTGKVKQDNEIRSILDSKGYSEFS